MTAVYRARDTVLERLVALKVLLPGADATTRERFRREARTAAMLEHPNIVRTYQVGEVPGSGLSYIAMELVDGPSLAAFLEQQPVLDPVDAATLLEPIARALAYAHERGVIHRDVKPSNILLREVDDEHPLRVEIGSCSVPLAPLLSDFGIARALDSPDLTSEGRTIGTPAFMSPEQCAGADEIDGRADIYSLGAVLYRCMIGRPPYVGSTTAILHAHVYDPLLVPNKAMQRLPAEALSVIRTSMRKRPAERYASAIDVAQELAELSFGGGGGTGSAADGRIEGADKTDVADWFVTQKDGVSPPSHVLVPAPSPDKRMSPRETTEVTKPYARMNEVHAPASKPRRRASRAGMLALIIALTTLVAMLALTVFSGVLPAIRGGLVTEPAAVVSDPTATATSETETGRGATATVSLSPPATATKPSGAAEGDVGMARPTTRPGTRETSEVMPQPAVSPTPESPPLQVSPAFAWRNAQNLFEEEDWSGAREWLIAAQRADPGFEADAVAEMLADVYVELATEALIDEEYDEALDFLNEAATVQDVEIYARLQQAVEALVDAASDDVSGEMGEVQMAFVSYAEHLADQERVCEAVAKVEFADQLGPDAGLDSAARDFATACEAKQVQAARSTLSGQILYSAVEGDEYDIFLVGVQEGSVPRRVVDQGAQPALSRDGRTLAFYSRRPDIPGLVATDWRSGQSSGQEWIRLTSFVEDARDSAPSWNPQGDRLAYGSMNFGDGRSRVYLTWADGTRDTAELGLGKDPAWHPSEDLIVFNGTDETGNNPGLWIMRTDGTERRQLTDNGNDQRPVWLPDGSAILFMSNGRDGNWELYRYDLNSAQVTRLTENTAQDGLPCVSPDGRHVAFMSDRDGYWALWYVSSGGGEAYPLADIAGELPKWLEHSTQWIP